MTQTAASIQQTIHGDPDSLFLNEDIVSGLSISSLECIECGLRFFPKLSLTIHFYKKHSADSKNALQESLSKVKEKNYHKKKQEGDVPRRKRKQPVRKVCEICGKSFGPNGYKKHMGTHTGQGMIPCPVCSKVFHKLSLKEHMQTHNKKEFRCKSCSKIFYSSRSLEKHTIEVHDGRVPGQIETNEFKCTACDKGFSSERWLMLHKKEIHDKHVQQKCDICKKIFTNTASFKIHMTKHQVDFPCKICGKIYKSKAMVQGHVKQVHEKDPDLTCKICGKVLSLLKYLRNHMEEHQENGKLACAVCGKLTLKHKMSNHMLIHGDKTFKCKICDKAFSQPSNLSAHFAVHDITKRTCEVCSKVFSSYYSRYVHQKKIHGHYKRPKDPGLEILKKIE